VLCALASFYKITIYILDNLFVQDVWIGHTLYDREPTIIHHFAQQATKFTYPHIASGFAMSITLLKRYISCLY